MKENDNINIETAIAKCDSLGASTVYIETKHREIKRNALDNDETKAQLHEYIFGDGDNPFEEFNKEKTRHYQETRNTVDMLIEKTKIIKNKRKINK